AKKLIQLLDYLNAEHDTPYGGDEMLFEILHFDFFGIPPIEIAKLSIEVADRQVNENKTSLRSLLQEKIQSAPRDLFDQGVHPGLKKAGVAVESLIGDVVNVTLQTLFENVIRKAGVLTTIIQSPDKIWHIQVVTALFDFIKEETR